MRNEFGGGGFEIIVEKAGMLLLQREYREKTTYMNWDYLASEMFWHEMDVSRLQQ